ncbi:hypothetical protein C8Q80DRAFT_1200884 [Daedaleopsis nitida]|nr:hypothetical protein C8Q80DRAFT_1200884 [Daedaleopsis nitida]
MASHLWYTVFTIGSALPPRRGTTTLPHPRAFAGHWDPSSTKFVCNIAPFESSCLMASPRLLKIIVDKPWMSSTPRTRFKSSNSYGHRVPQRRSYTARRTIYL